MIILGLTLETFQDKKLCINENTYKASSTFGTPTGAQKTNSLRETLSGQRATIAKICEEGKIFIII